MRKRITTSIEENALKELDIKIVYSDCFKDRSGYLEFLLQLLPFIPNDINPDTDIKEVIRKMYVNSGADLGAPEQVQKKNEGGVQAVDAEGQEIIKMARNFKLKTTVKGTNS